MQKGDSVQMQNQYGNHPKKWSNTGLFAEVLPIRQYQVIVDGSGRVTLGNRKFLKKITPIARRIDLDPGLPVASETATLPSTRAVSDTNMPNLQVSNEVNDMLSNTEATNEDVPIAECPQVLEQSPIQPSPRRSGRIRTQTKFLSPKMSGKSHE